MILLPFPFSFSFPFVSSAVETPISRARRMGVSTALDTNGLREG
jgi:hypothetical protein